MIHHYSRPTSTNPRNLHPEASIIRYEENDIWVFDSSDDAIGHFTANLVEKAK